MFIDFNIYGMKRVASKSSLDFVGDRLFMNLFRTMD